MTAEPRQRDFEQRNQHNSGTHRYVVDNNTGAIISLSVRAAVTFIQVMNVMAESQ